MEQSKRNWTVAALAVIGGSLAVGPVWAFDSQDSFGGFLAKGKDRLNPAAQRVYNDAVRKTADMVNDSEAQRLTSQYKLDLLNLTWEDTGRYKGSSVGPNISDMTIQVAVKDPKTQQLAATCMPVIRYPNFADKSCDLAPRDFTLLVGNQVGE